MPLPQASIEISCKHPNRVKISVGVTFQPRCVRCALKPNRRLLSTYIIKIDAKSRWFLAGPLNETYKLELAFMRAHKILRILPHLLFIIPIAESLHIFRLLFSFVIPAEAGIQRVRVNWTPAYAGVTFGGGKCK